MVVSYLRVYSHLCNEITSSWSFSGLQFFKWNFCSCILITFMLYDNFYCWWKYLLYWFYVTFTVTDGSVWKCTSPSLSLTFAHLNPELIRSRFYLRQQTSSTEHKVCEAIISVANNKPRRDWYSMQNVLSQVDLEGSSADLITVSLNVDQDQLPLNQTANNV